MVLGAWPQQFAALDSRSNFDSRVQETVFDLSIDSIVRVCQHHLREGVRVNSTDRLHPAGGCPVKPNQNCLHKPDATCPPPEFPYFAGDRVSSSAKTSLGLDAIRHEPVGTASMAL